jgi:hypothetical protein
MPHPAFTDPKFRRKKDYCCVAEHEPHAIGRSFVLTDW